MIKKNLIKTCAVLLILGVTFLLWGKDFFRISTKATGPAGYYQGGIWADLNGDDLIDVFLLANRGQTATPSGIAVLNEQNQLFFQQFDGSFRKVHDDPLVNIKGNFTSATVGDYNNDGYPDIFITNGENYPMANDLEYRNLLFANNGDGSFRRILDQPLVNENVPSVDCCWGDFDKDGHLDLYICNRGTRNSLFRNLGDGTFIKVTGSPPTEIMDGRGCSWADFNKDGLVDLFVARGGDLPCMLYQNNGEGIFSDLTPVEMTADIFPDPREKILSLWIDLDNNNWLDLAIFPGNNEPPRLYKNLQDGNFSRILEGPFQIDAHPGHAAAFGDYDNDCDLDLFLAGKNSDSSNYLFINGGNGTFSQQNDGMMMSDTTNATMECKWWDLNQDGFLDLYFLRRIDENRIYQNRQQGNTWLKVRCVGAQSNRAAIGALVQVKTRIGETPVTQVRSVTAQSAGEQSLHFGLGQASLADRVSVWWPSGHWQHLTDVDVNQRLIIHEDPVADVLPPNHFSVTRLENSLLFFKEYINRLEWEPNVDNTTAIIHYRLYRKPKDSADSEYIFITKIDGEVFFYEDAMLAPNQLFTYKITAVSQEGGISRPVFASN